MKFDKVISLGPACETAWQIRQIVDQPEAYVFDWVIASASSVAKAISTDFSAIVHSGQLSLKNVDSGDHPYVLDAATGIEYHHDFRNDADFIATLPNVQQKYNFLKDRMRRLLASDKTILFVHHKGTPDDARILEAAIFERFPTLNFNLLELGIGGKEEPPRREGRLILARIEGRGSSWQDRMPEWENVIEAILADSFDKTLTRVEPSLKGTQ